MQRSQFPTPVVFVLSLYLLYILSIPDTHDSNACTCFNASLGCTSDTNGCNTSHAGSILYQYLVRVCSIQATSKEYRIPHVSWSNSQGSRLIGKTRAGKLRKKRKKQGQRERREEREGECPTAWIITSHWRRSRKSQRHSILGWQKDARCSLESIR